MRHQARLTLPDRITVRIGDLPPQAKSVLLESKSISQAVREALLFYAGCLTAREVLQGVPPRQATVAPNTVVQDNAAFTALLGGITAAIGEK